MEEAFPHIELGVYDVVVMADVLEHMPDPLSGLTRVAKGMRQNARLIASMPNIAFGAIALELLRGRFEYRDLGLMDRTHVRFFTRDGVLQLFSEAGMHVQLLCHLVRALPSMEIPVRPGPLSWLLLPWLSARLDSSTYQHIVVAGKEPSSMETRVYRDGSRTKRLRQTLAVYFPFLRL